MDRLRFQDAQVRIGGGKTLARQAPRSVLYLNRHVSTPRRGRAFAGPAATYAPIAAISTTLKRCSRIPVSRGAGIWAARPASMARIARSDWIVAGIGAGSQGRSVRR